MTVVLKVEDAEEIIKITSLKKNTHYFGVITGKQTLQKYERNDPCELEK